MRAVVSTAGRGAVAGGVAEPQGAELRGPESGPVLLPQRRRPGAVAGVVQDLQRTCDAHTTGQAGSGTDGSPGPRRLDGPQSCSSAPLWAHFSEQHSPPTAKKSLMRNRQPPLPAKLGSAGWARWCCQRIATHRRIRQPRNPALDLPGTRRHPSQPGARPPGCGRTDGSFSARPPRRRAPGPRATSLRLSRDTRVRSRRPRRGGPTPRPVAPARRREPAAPHAGPTAVTCRACRRSVSGAMARVHCVNRRHA